MNPETATVFAAAIGAVAVLIAALISKYDLFSLFKKTTFNLSGNWQGMSVYMPIDSYNVGSECVYSFSAVIKQSGNRLKLLETIKDFFDLNMTKLELPLRIIEGNGKIVGEKDVIIQFTEKGSVNHGTMYLSSNSWGKELQGIIAVRNPYIGTPSIVKIILGRSDSTPVTPEKLGINKVKAMVDAVLKHDKTVSTSLSE